MSALASPAYSPPPPLQALVVDDERLARRALVQVLEANPAVTVAAEADSIEAARELLGRMRPDVVFLDVVLVDGTGFDLFEHLDESVPVVFVTAHSDFAVRAFGVDATDYLLKPPTPADVRRAVLRVADRHVEARQVEAPARALDVSDRICLQDAGTMRLCEVGDVDFVQAHGDFVEFHLVDGSTALDANSLRFWEEHLGGAFVRVHRSTLVRLHAITALVHEGQGWHVRVRERDAHLPVSRRHVQVVKGRLEAYRPSAR